MDNKTEKIYQKPVMEVILMVGEPIMAGSTLESSNAGYYNSTPDDEEWF
ncbi:MAG: hypothetical protein ACI4TM_00930 [Candidatus Cryptobacteroides sp.]